MKEIKITSPEKVLFPKDKISKLQVVEYYIDIGNHMLPFVKNRLLSVIRCHENINEEKFYKKHPTNEKHLKKFKDKDEEYFYITTLSELAMQAQMGTLEFHIWGSSVNKIDSPNLMIFDLDPDEKLSLKFLRQGVIKVKEILEEVGLKSYLKTSGGKGYHIVVPFKKNKDWKDFYDFARNVALLAEERHPKIFTTNIKKSTREGKIFIDYLRNHRGSTCVAPYSLRAREGATISMPIDWTDLNKIKPNQINIKNYKKYLNNSWEDLKC